MAASRQTKSSFTAGELAPELLGRADLRAYANGARRLRNVFIQPTGGVTRRPGLRHIATLPGPARLLAFEFNTEQTYLLVFTHNLFSVYLDDALVAQGSGPWSAAQLAQLAFTQSADTLLICHPDTEPRRLSHLEQLMKLAGEGEEAAATDPADIALGQARQEMEDEQETPADDPGEPG